MKIIKPQKLKKGDTIGILAVSGAIKDFKQIENAKSFFESQGYKVKISNTCKTSHRYMAGNCDSECAKALNEYFSDKSINAILCARGGYGALRLLDKINFDIIKENPKIFAGYSDITILLNMIFKKTGLITFHSAMAKGDFGETIEPYTKNSFFKTLSGEKTEYTAENITLNSYETVSGRIFGGNLASLISLCGLDFIPAEDLILILEDLNEPVYKIDKMLTQLFNIKKSRENIKAIAIGEFKDIEDIDMLNEVISEKAKELNIPICNGFKITHNKIKDTIPIGVKADFDTKNGIIKLTEPYVI